MPNRFGPACATNRESADADTTELLERFQAAPTKIAVQKDGMLTGLSRAILHQLYGVTIPYLSEDSKVLVNVSEDGAYGFVHARSKAICDLVANCAVDLAVVGSDRLIEDGAEETVDVIGSFPEHAKWPLVIATPTDSPLKSPAEISRVATQYPIITGRFFGNLGLPDVEIVSSAGGTELYPYLQYGADAVDAVVDLVSTGQTLRAHNLVPWTPAIAEVYPVLIQARES